jgi:cytochrome c553
LVKKARSQEPEATIRSLALLLAMLASGTAIAADKLPPGEGKRIVETVCSSCHPTDVVTSKSYSRERWRAVVEAMISEGASLTKAEAAQVVEYLARNFGEKERERQLFVEICSYCHELERVTRQALTREEWQGLIRGMVDEGAPVTSEEFAMIVDYLAEHFGPRR